MLAHLLGTIRAARPALSLVPRTVVEATLLTRGALGSACNVAGWLGLRNRFELARLLRRQGLPPLHRLRAWAALLSWVDAAEREGVSLFRLAFRSGRHPAACYRLVREITGKCWEEVLERGLSWVERQFIRELRAHHPYTS